MSSASVDTTLRWRAPTRRTRTLGLRHGLRPHAAGIGSLMLAAVWLTRHWLWSSALPAGTDMLGFVSRAAQNSDPARAVSLWAPNGWGARRTITLESLLGLAARIVGDPVLAVKLFSVAVLFTTAVTAYAFAWRTHRSRLGATTAGLIYMTSQQSLSHWASGHLNVGIGIALIPLILLLWMESVRTFSVARSCALALAISVVILARPDLFLYSVPFLALYVAVRVALTPGTKATLRNALVTAVVALPSAAALSFYLVIPAIAGIRARWLTVGSLFAAQQLFDRSLDAYPSLLGFAREIGYFAFTGQPTWNSHPWLPFSAYSAAASVVVLLALAALLVQRDERTIYLVAVAVTATLMGKGPRAPLGLPYRWLVSHVPAFSDLRDPNRWLILQALAYAVLAGITVSWLERKLRRSGGMLISVAVTGVLLGALLLPVAPVLVTGLRTVEVSPADQALLGLIAADRQQSLVASIPYDQTYRFVKQHGYRGWEHDLGSESVAFTGHPAVGDGGWSQYAADAVAFTAHLLRRRDPAFGALLGTLGVKYLLDLSYPETDPHLLVGGAGPYSQQREAATLPRLRPVMRDRGGALYRLETFAPVVSFRPNLAVVLGGRAGIAAFADQPRIRLSEWAVFTADDLLAAGGVHTLLSVARHARALVVADTTPNDLAVLASPTAASLRGITSDPGLDARTQIIPSDGSTRLGSLASQTAPPARSGASVSTATVTCTRAETLELWARIRSSPSAATLSFSIDGTRVGSLTPVTLVGGGFRWYLVRRQRLLPGTHRLIVRAHASEFGRTYELDEARLIRRVDRLHLRARFAALLERHASRTVFAYSPAETQPPLSLHAIVRRAVEVGPRPGTFWRVLEPARVSVTRDGGLTLAPHGPRRYHTLVDHAFAHARNWANVDYLLLRFRGTGSGATYRLVVDFTKNHTRSFPLFFTDRRPGWQIAVLSNPKLGTPHSGWSHVRSVRIATDDRRSTDTLELGPLSVSRASAEAIDFRIAASRTSRTIRVGGRQVAIPPRAPGFAVRLTPKLLRADERVSISAPAPLAPIAGRGVRYRRAGPTTYRFRTGGRSGGVLLLAQSFDPRWQATVNGHTVRALPAYGLVNGYVLPPGVHTGSIRFRGDDLGWLGIGLSGASLLGLLVVVWTFRKRTEGWGTP